MAFKVVMMDEHKILARLFYLLIQADGKVDHRELAMGNTMLIHEKLDQSKFEAFMARMEDCPKHQLIKECINELKMLDTTKQIQYMAWMCLIANADGFMDAREWALIFQIYHKGLNLDKKAIMKRQLEIKTALGKTKANDQL
ncbi:hypothetical protein FNH22_01840 [Fulvivirga sp. M361]|nr:hypothetical protein FNH22_01840 [Fulvivirga sp. M361]